MKTGEEDMYVSTLAARSFQMFIAIAVKFDLELKQWDAVNTFIHTSLNGKPMYMKMLPGWRGPRFSRKGEPAENILRLNKVLYSLQKSPVLWQRMFTEKLHTISFKTIPHKPCCLIQDGILVFFYVDDIVLVY